MFKCSIYSVYLFVLCFFVLLSDMDCTPESPGIKHQRNRQVKENRYYVFILRGHVVVRMMFYEKN